MPRSAGRGPRRRGQGDAEGAGPFGGLLGGTAAAVATRWRHARLGRRARRGSRAAGRSCATQCRARERRWLEGDVSGAERVGALGGVLGGTADADGALGSAAPARSTWSACARRVRTGARTDRDTPQPRGTVRWRGARVRRGRCRGGLHAWRRARRHGRRRRRARRWRRALGLAGAWPCTRPGAGRPL
jgi:hypothetical protein